jgi:hypothetical protein
MEVGAHLLECIREVLLIRAVRHRLRRAASDAAFLLEIGDRAIEASYARSCACTPMVA